MNNRKEQVKNSGGGIVYIALIIGLALIAAMLTAAFSIENAGKSKAEATLQSYYRASLIELSDSVDEVELRLSKLSVGLSKRGANENLDELSTHASTAVCALSRLPVSSEQTYAAVKLLNQIVDYAKNYDAALSRGGDTDGFIKSAAAFRRAVDVLQERVRSCVQAADSGAKLCADTLQLEGVSAETDDGQQAAPAYPEMIYDGPFSDSRLPVCFKGLQDLEEISEAQAQERFNKLFNTSDAKIVGRSQHPDAYEIEGGGSYASLSVQGGMVLSLTAPGNVGGTNLSQEDAFLHAAEYAAKLGYGDLQPVWFLNNDGVAYINMTPLSGDAILYTDLVKVKLSMTDGTLLGLEATGFCRNHIQREIEAAISPTTAAAMSGVYHDSVRLCVIPDNETEAVCYEVHGSYDGMEFYVYVDAVSGEKVKVLKVVGSSGGNLTM